MSFSIPISQVGSIGESVAHEKKAARSSAVRGVIFVLAHIPLALAMRQYPQVATIHALGTLLVGMRWAITKGAERNTAYVAAYITGAEVLWRMTQADVVWEFGKYATSIILITSLLRNGRLRMPLLPVLYFALLTPAIVPTVMEDYFGIEQIRQFLSFHLSGPFALVVCAWFFSHVEFTLAQFERLLVTLIAPTLSIAFITLFSTMTAANLTWSTHSNFVSSGGYGPNQVSAALGLGTLVSLLFLLKSQSRTYLKIMAFGAMVFFAIQSAMTFSRGGLYGAAGAALVAIYYMSRDRQARLKVVFVGVVTVLLAAFVVLPSLESITGGKLSARFENTSTTGRSQIVESDLDLWAEHPIFGVGVGMSFYRESGWKDAHTEFTRLLAEHGSFGFLALVLLLVGGWQKLRAAETPKGRAIMAALVAWSLLFMLDKAMRLVAPSFTFGLAFATLEATSFANRTYTVFVKRRKQTHSQDPSVA